jgi:hypothetical protein
MAHRRPQPVARAAARMLLDMGAAGLLRDGPARAARQEGGGRGAFATAADAVHF